MSRTARYGSDRTNQKLYFAKLACLAAQQSDTAQAQQASLESAVFHLYGAYQAFLQELVRFYQLSLTQPTLVSIKHTLVDNAQVSPELALLENAVLHGFLGELSRAFTLCQYAPKTFEQDTSVQSTNLIIKATQSTHAWLPSDVLIHEWHEQLQDCIAQCRRGMVEN